MKIMHFISTKGVFGAEKVVISLSERQKKSGWDVRVGVLNNTYNSHIEIVREAWSKDVSATIFNCRNRWDLGLLLSLRRYIIDNKIDIVHSHGYKSNFYTLLSTLFLDVKRFATCHTWYSHSIKMKAYEILDKIFLRKFHKITVVNDSLKNELLKSGISSDRVSVIHNGIDLNEFYQMDNEARMDLKETFGIKRDELVLGIIARLAVDKGHVYLIKAFRDVLREIHYVKLLIVGDGDERRSLVKLTKELGIEKNVVFAGIRKDIPQILSLLDIFVLPSLKEGLPIALLEAMAGKKAIIATKVGAIPDVAQDNVSGIIIEPAHVRLLERSIIDLLNNPEKRERLAENAYSRVKEKYSVERMSGEYNKLYQSLFQSEKVGTKEVVAL